MRKMGCSTAVGLPSSGSQEKLGATAGVVAADPSRGAAVTSVIIIVVPRGARLRLGLPKSRPGAESCQGRERKSNSTQWKGLGRIKGAELCTSRLLRTWRRNSTQPEAPASAGRVPKAHHAAQRSLKARLLSNTIWHGGLRQPLATSPNSAPFANLTRLVFQSQLTQGSAPRAHGYARSPSGVTLGHFLDEKLGFIQRGEFLKGPRSKAAIIFRSVIRRL